MTFSDTLHQTTQRPGSNITHHGICFFLVDGMLLPGSKVADSGTTGAVLAPSFFKL